MTDDIFSDLMEQIDEFSNSIENVYQKNSDLFTARLNEEQKLITQIKTMIESDVFSRACLGEPQSVLERIVPDAMSIGKSVTELHKLIDAITKLINKQIKKEQAIINAVNKKLPYELTDNMSDLLNSNLFLKYSNERMI